MAFCGIEVEPGKPYVHYSDEEKGRLHVSQETLGAGSSTKKRILQCKVGDKKPIYLCSLLPEKLENCALNLEFDEGEEATFSIIGSHNVRLSGFFYGDNENQDNLEDDYGFDSYEEGVMVTDSVGGGIADGEKQAGVCTQINLLSLPDDLLLKILLNLSAQDIYYAASRVCRSLYYLTIRSEEFVDLHLRQTDEYGLFFRFICAPTRALINSDEHSSRRAVFMSMKQGRVTLSDYYYPYKSRFFLQTSCNGLVLEYKFCSPLSEVHVANPVTGRPFQLPPLLKNAKLLWCCVGYAEASKAYKVALTYIDTDGGRVKRRAILTVGVDKSWRHLETDQYLTEPTLSRPMVTEGFVHLILRDIVWTLNVGTEVMTMTRAPVPVDYPNYTNWYLSAGKALTLVDKVEDGMFRVWEMVYGDYNYYYWREWERQIVLGSRRMREIREVCGDKDLAYIHPVGWLQQMEVLVCKGFSRNEPCKIFYIVIATGDIGWITPISSNKEGLVGEVYTILGSVLSHKNTLVQLEG